MEGAASIVAESLKHLNLLIEGIVASIIPHGAYHASCLVYVQPRKEFIQAHARQVKNLDV